MGQTINGGFMKLSNMKKFNAFIFFTMLAKYCVDLFLPIILYKLNYSINTILIFLLVCGVVNILIAIPITKLGRKFGFKYFLIISLIFFVLLYLAVSYMKKSFCWLIIIILLNCLSNTMYYLSRHNYAAIALDNQKTKLGVGSIIIASIFASMFASILSTILLDKISIKFITIIVSIIYLIGCLFIFFIKVEEKESHDNLRSIHKKLPKNNKLFYLIEQFKVIFFMLYPLYVYVYINNTYTYIGILYLITAIASIIFIYFYSKKNSQKDYLKLSSILLSLVLFVDMLNLNKYIMLGIVFIEGIITKVYDLSVTKIMYSMQKSLEGSSYFLYMEILYGIGRIMILLFMLLFQIKLKTILYIAIIFIFISGFINVNIEE